MNDQTKKQTGPEVVIEAEFEDVTSKKADTAQDVGIRAGAALDAFADVVARVAPEEADKLRAHAGTARSVGKDIERAQVAGNELISSAKAIASKLGLDKIEMVRRVHPRAAAHAREKAARAAAGEQK
jgi:hypothetical protein